MAVCSACAIYVMFDLATVEFGVAALHITDCGIDTTSTWLMTEKGVVYVDAGHCYVLGRALW